MVVRRHDREQLAAEATKKDVDEPRGVLGGRLGVQGEGVALLLVEGDESCFGLGASMEKRDVKMAAAASLDLFLDRRRTAPGKPVRVELGTAGSRSALAMHACWNSVADSGVRMRLPVAKP